MSALRQGFCQDKALRRSAVKKELGEKGARKRLKRTVEDFLNVFEAELSDDELERLEHADADADTSLQQLFTPAVSSRCVTIGTCQPAQTQRMELLNKLYYGEQKLLEDLQRMTLSQILKCDQDQELFTEGSEEGEGKEGDGEEGVGGEKDGGGHEFYAPLPKVTDGEHLLKLRGLECSLRNDVDELARAKGYLSYSYSSRGGVDGLVTHWAQALLHDFFDVCKEPNEAEKLMLTEACGLEDVEETERWFEESRVYFAPLLDAQAMQWKRKRCSARMRAAYLWNLTKKASRAGGTVPANEATKNALCAKHNEAGEEMLNIDWDKFVNYDGLA
ncbi:hypothetical protein B0A50_06499 [Salinomyces thailandicus]|uniref:Uncharacterized protein n=1 Tax=Salinomyces thailandicus TaxID=706561 RepID=A0A4U0TNR2_9PEZI|nr:hypothetical protein B0A50_06499 [Salinomyces thailandica]